MSFGFGGRRLSGVDLLGLGDLKVTAIDERHDGVTVDAEAIELEELLPHELRKPFKQVISYMRHTRWRRLILNYFDHRYTNAYAESLNGLIDAVQRAGRGYDFETLRAKALLRYGPFRYEAANKMNFLTFLRYHGVDLSTFEDDLRAGRF